MRGCATRRVTGASPSRWTTTAPSVKQFEDAGLRIYLYNVNFNETFTDAERDRTFEAAKVLGAEGFSSSTVLSEARRLVPFAERHKMFVAMHNHNNLVDPDQFATPASFETALALSDRFRVTLDIGHFVAGNNDPVAFISKHHDHIVNVHVRDRKRDNGPNRPFGQGDTPIREVLRLIRDNRYAIRAYLEYEYGSFRSSLEETRAMFQYLQGRAGMSRSRARLTRGLLIVALVATRGTMSVRGQATPQRDAGGYPAPTAALERGRTVFVLNHCHFCHGEDLTRANMGAANLAQSALVGADTDGNAIGAVVRAGLPNLQTAMPSYRDLSSQEVVDLARYIHYLRQQARYNELIQPEARAQGDAARGRALFAGAGTCASCHASGNALAGIARKYDAAALRARLLRPGPPKPVEGVEPTAGQSAHLKLLENYTAADVDDLLAYLRELN